jgi:hypothetical protein
MFVRSLDLLTNLRNETKCTLDKYVFTTEDNIIINAQG